MLTLTAFLSGFGLVLGQVFNTQEASLLHSAELHLTGHTYGNKLNRWILIIRNTWGSQGLGLFLATGLC
jgi:hypothetical protein